MLDWAGLDKCREFAWCQLFCFISRLISHDEQCFGGVVCDGPDLPGVEVYWFERFTGVGGL
jgi:hypothetical protein